MNTFLVNHILIKLENKSIDKNTGKLEESMHISQHMCMLG